MPDVLSADERAAIDAWLAANKPTVVKCRTLDEIIAAGPEFHRDGHNFQARANADIAEAKAKERRRRANEERSRQAYDRWAALAAEANSLDEIARKVGIRRDSVLEALRRHGIPSPEKLNPQEQRRTLLRERFKAAYSPGRSYTEIAEEVGIKPATVSRWARAMGLEERARKPGPKDKSAAAAALYAARVEAARQRYAPFLDGTRTVPEIARAVGVSASAVGKYVRNNGLQHLVRR